MSLWSDFLVNDGRVIHKWKHYFPIYERHFRDFVNKPVTFLEIGCGAGGSLQMWRRFFGPHARVIGVDIRSECQTFGGDQIEVRIGDQSDPVFLRKLMEEFGPLDIVLDDGSHVMSHVLASFRALYPCLSKSGVYLVEDMHTAYWPEYEGGLGKASTFIEISKHLIDELNAVHTRGALAESEFSRTTAAMHFYDSIVVFERGTTTRKWAPQIGAGVSQEGA